jgi:hypothetical protein
LPFSSRARAGVALCTGVFLVLFLRLQPPKKERRNLLLTDFAGAFVFRRRPLEDANCYIFKKIKKSPFIRGKVVV